MLRASAKPPEGLDSESKTVKVFLFLHLFFLRVGPLLARCNFFCGLEMSRTQSEKSGQQRNDRQGTGKSVNNGVLRVFLLLPIFLSEKSEKSEKEMKVKAQEHLSINDANRSPKPQIVDQKNLSLIPLLEGAAEGAVTEGVGPEPKPEPWPPFVRVSTFACIIS